MTSIPRYKNRMVRDLFWSCFGPSLVTDFGPDTKSIDQYLLLTAERLEWFQQLDQNPDELVAHINSIPHQRLGLYSESLWHFFFQHDPEFELVANNLAVRDKTRTLGEYDLIVFNHSQQCYLHIELAVKFYLWSGSPTLEPSKITHFEHWLGPNCRDRFNRKWQHLTQQQIRLSDTFEGKAKLAGLGIEKIDTCIGLKGALFYPHVLSTHNHYQLSPTHWHGSWLTVDQAADLPSNPYWKILDKTEWLSPFYADLPVDHATGLLTQEKLFDQLTLYFEHQQRPLMISALNKNQQGFNETGRFFITDNQWPNSLIESA